MIFFFVHLFRLIDGYPELTDTTQDAVSSCLNKFELCQTDQFILCVIFSFLPGRFVVHNILKAYIADLGCYRTNACSIVALVFKLSVFCSISIDIAINNKHNHPIFAFCFLFISLALTGNQCCFSYFYPMAKIVILWERYCMCEYTDQLFNLFV